MIKYHPVRSGVNAKPFIYCKQATSYVKSDPLGDVCSHTMFVHDDLFRNGSSLWDILELLLVRFFFFQHKVRIRGVAHGSSLTIRFSRGTDR